MPIEAVIFDLDGTLLHTELDFDLIRQQIGISSGPILEALDSMSDADRRRAMKILDEHESKAAGEARLNVHAPAVFEVLVELGIKTALLTRNSRASVKTAIERHNLKFDFVCSREDLSGKIKPSPEPVLAICAALQVRPADTLMVGDYLFDLQSANAAGSRSVLLRNERNAEFIPFAWRTIDSLEELIDFLGSDLTNNE
ncbi:MAG: HAD-IA family hydrolase [Actinobacteria bacterium]|nr:HAD-IA family hydrolase [Actinomycetota bacterium]